MILNYTEKQILIKALDTEMGMTAKTILKQEKLLNNSSGSDEAVHFKTAIDHSKTYFNDLLNLQIKLKGEK